MNLPGQLPLFQGLGVIRIPEIGNDVENHPRKWIRCGDPVSPRWAAEIIRWLILCSTKNPDST